MRTIDRALIAPPDASLQAWLPARGTRVSPPMQTRIELLDLLRGISVLVMILAHCTDAFLDPAFKSGATWTVIDFFFGLVAPAFLLASGVTLWISLERDRSTNSSRN